MDTLHKHLAEQINKYLPDESLQNNPAVRKLIKAINKTYQTYDRDAELVEQSMQLNDLEFKEINKKINDQLDKKKNVQARLIQEINELNGYDDISCDSESNLFQLLHILRQEIEYKKKFEEQLYNAKSNAEKANQAKSDFLSNMSHEIRTPLNAIIGLLYIMEKEDTIDSFHENLDVLKSSAHNLLLLINDILDFNKIESGKVELEHVAFNFTNLIQDIVRSLKPKAVENHNQIRISIDDDFIPEVIGDPLRISQVITNLIVNAIKFTKDGLISIKVDQIATENDNSIFRVEVIDNGIGIDLKKFNNIFQKFTQADTKTSRQFGGSGLGLVISKELLRLMHSDIELKSELGSGSNFSFVLKLPINHKNSEYISSLGPKNYKEENLSGLKILLVEDNLINVMVAEKILKQWDVEVDVASNGLIAVNKNKSAFYDLILMDLSMPVMDGYEATTIIRSENSSIPIIALTATTSFQSLEKARQIGMDDYITKPFNPTELNVKLSKYYHY